MLNTIVIFVPFITGVMVDFSWRLVMMFTSIMALLQMFCVLQFPELKGTKSEIKFDYWGVVLLFFGVGMLDISFTILSKAMYIVFAIMFVTSIIILFVFYKVECKHKDPILPIKILKNPILEYSIGNMLFMFAIKGSEYIYPQIFAFHGKMNTSLGLV